MTLLVLEEEDAAGRADMHGTVRWQRCPGWRKGMTVPILVLGQREAALGDGPETWVWSDGLLCFTGPCEPHPLPVEATRPSEGEKHGYTFTEKSDDN